LAARRASVFSRDDYQKIVADLQSELLQLKSTLSMSKRASLGFGSMAAAAALAAASTVAPDLVQVLIRLARLCQNASQRSFGHFNPLQAASLSRIDESAAEDVPEASDAVLSDEQDQLRLLAVQAARARSSSAGTQLGAGAPESGRRKSVSEMITTHSLVQRIVENFQVSISRQTFLWSFFH